MAKSKRKAKSAKDFRRRDPYRHEPDRVLIVTEGSKTEPDYFRLLISELDLATAKIKIVGDGGSAPVSVVKDAEEYLKKDNDFEQVYCVFDRDRHERYDEALLAVEKLSKKRAFSKKIIMAIPSIPCFEVWYLLHETKARKPYQAKQTGGSPCDALVKDLRKYDVFSDYKKVGCEAFFEAITPKREKAIKHAELFLKDAKQESAKEYHENPSTRVHLVVQALMKISQKM